MNSVNQRYYEKLGTNDIGHRQCVICPKMSLDTLPFQLWAAMSYSVYDIKALSYYTRERYWYEYRCDCAYMGFSYQPAKMFGLDG